MVDLKKELGKIPSLRDSHWINIVVRRNGKEETYEADWLKDLQKENADG